jgi:hypothetical protein
MLSAVFLNGLTGCGSSSKGAAVSISLKLTSNATPVHRAMERAVESLSLDPGRFTRHFLNGSVDSGGASASQLLSLKYFIAGIQICQSMTTQGSAYTSQSGCAMLFGGPTDATLNPTSGFGSAGYAAMASYAATATTGFIDLMDPTSRATIATGGTIGTPSVPAGAYNWGIIQWSYPIKVTASMTTSAGTLYTRPGTTDSNNLTTASTSFTSGGTGGATPQEGVVSLPNGGTWIKFQSPFNVVATDTVSVALAFNPDNLIRGFYVTGGATPPSNLSYYDGASKSGDAINVPFLDMTPIPLRGSDQAIVESYLTNNSSSPYTISGTTDTFQIRLELYYNSSDTTKAISGATIRVIPQQNSQYSTDIQKIASITAGAGGTLSFNDYSGAAIISGFTRQTALNGTTTASIPCGNSTSNFTPSGCASGSSLTPTFVLTAVNALN